jgi:hypothetical protein
MSDSFQRVVQLAENGHLPRLYSRDPNYILPFFCDVEKMKGELEEKKWNVYDFAVYNLHRQEIEAFSKVHGDISVNEGLHLFLWSLNVANLAANVTTKEETGKWLVSYPSFFEFLSQAQMNTYFESFVKGASITCHRVFAMIDYESLKAFSDDFLIKNVGDLEKLQKEGKIYGFQSEQVTEALRNVLKRVSVEWDNPHPLSHVFFGIIPSKKILSVSVVRITRPSVVNRQVGHRGVLVDKVEAVSLDEYDRHEPTDTSKSVFIEYKDGEDRKHVLDRINRILKEFEESTISVGDVSTQFFDYIQYNVESQLILHFKNTKCLGAEIIFYTDTGSATVKIIQQK